MVSFDGFFNVLGISRSCGILAVKSFLEVGFVGLANVVLDCRASVLELSSFAVLPCSLTGPGFRGLKEVLCLCSSSVSLLLF